MKKQGLVLLTLLMALILGVNLALAGPGTKAAPVKLPAPFNTGPNGDTYTYYANSPSGKWNTAFSNASSNSGTPLRKFVDRLPGLGAAAANNLGAYIPIATPKTNPVAGDPADYYEIELTQYNQQMHSDLPGPSNGGGLGTKLRGYRDLSNNNPARYLGPLIVARTYDPTKPPNVNGNGAPVRVKFINNLGVSNGVDGQGDLFIPVDSSAMGAGLGPDSWLVDPLTGLVSPSGFLEKYRQNRAELHLHGGATPWISDGTPHQWITPAADAARYKTGVSKVDVPDMPAPGPGAATYYWSNQQSGRLMWYHDHAYGLTRLNAYVGNAAGYLLTDQIESDLIAGTNVSLINPTLTKLLPDLGTPLVIQDKTFVPQDIAVQDAKWTNPLWGGYGDLWFPHVYEPNQNPLSRADGSNPYGRWDYGPWFWPPVQLVNNFLNLPSAGSNNDPSLTPEGFMDTALVNGTVYPYMDVEPKAYRFRVLNGANDRPLNLQFYVSDPTSPDNFSSLATNNHPTEVAMLPAARWPDCKSNTPATPTAPLTCTCSAAFAPFGCTPLNWPHDGRDGGVPDPQFIGPSMIQIGTEGGILPAPVVINNQPIDYEYNRRNIVVLDVLRKSLLLAPAERADILVDFTAFAGKTIILYNDAPAPMPAFDARYDYYTGNLDQTANGGAPSTKPGYGPNTRTVMQFRVGTATTGTVLRYKDASNNDTALVAELDTAIKAAFKSSQPAPIIPESTYGPTYGTTFPDVYSTIYDNSLTFTPLAGGTPITVGMASKAIQELWDPYGRMNATLGVELPMTNNRVQTTIPYGYIDPPTEVLNDNGQHLLWKITHNGVDTHPVHFHLFNVQVINRVGWDGAIRAPDANELGWKETVRMKPLEDVVVAFQPVLPKLPFGIPKSSRLLDPAFPAGAISTVNAAGAFTGDGPVFMNIDAVTGTPVIVTNILQDFGHEYVWHCHILGHEENDFMRPLVVLDTSVIPATPVLSSVTADALLTWTDATPPATSLGNAGNEVGFRIERDSTNTGVFTVVGNALANATSFLDVSVASNTAYSYRVVSFNAAGASVPSNAMATTTATFVFPSVSITEPLNTEVYQTGTAIPIIVNASTLAPGLSISRVEIYDNGNLLATVSASPFTYLWTNAAVGTHNLTAIAYDSIGRNSTSVVISITVSTSASSVVILTSNPLPLGTANVLYDKIIAVTGGTPPYTWSPLVGTLPTGLTYFGGRLYGIPNTLGTYNFTVSVNDSLNAGTSKTFTLTMTTDPLVITTASTLPASTLGSGVSYYTSLAATGGLAPFTWFVASGSALPPGISLIGNVLSGTPTTAGTYNFSLQVADSQVPKLNITKAFTLVINPAALVISTASPLPAFTLGTGTYSASLAATGGTTPYQWTVAPGSALPAGLAISGSTVTGKPLTAGTYNFNLQVTDSQVPPVTISKAFSLILNPAASLAITTASPLPTFIQGSGTYFTSIAATGGVAPYTWSLAAGSAPLPPGISLVSNLLTGFPTSGGTFTFNLKVADSQVPAVTTTKAFTLVLTPGALVITTASPLPAFTLGSASGTYSAPLVASGGVAPYSWAVSPGSTLPAGLSISGSSLTGIPVTSGAYTFSLQVTDSQVPAVTTTKPFSLTLNPAATLAIGTTSPLPAYTLGTGIFSVPLTASGGVAPYTWSVASGSTLPDGLAVTGTTLSGTPTLAGAYNFNLQVADSQVPAVTTTKAFTLVVSAPPAAVVTSPVNGTVLTGSTQTFTWSNTGATAYQLWVGTSPGNLDIGVFYPVAAANDTTTSATGLPVDGRTVYVRLYSLSNGSWLFNDYTYTASAPTVATMVSPANNAVFTGASQTFTWTNSGATTYQLWVGSTQGNLDIGVFYPAGAANATSTTATGLPVNGSVLYIRLYSLSNGVWSFNDYTYTAFNATLTASILTPVNNAILTGASQIFTWTNSGASSYQLWVGSTPGALDYGVFAPTVPNDTTVTATGLPVNGNALYVTLYSLANGVWTTNSYTYTASGSPAAAVMVAPADLSIIAKSGQVFTWTASNASSYQLWVGTTPGALDLGVFLPATPDGTTTTTTGLPASTVVYVTLYSNVGGVWSTSSSSYTTGP